MKRHVALFLLAACKTESSFSDPAVAALSPWPTEPTELLERCDNEPFAELAITCRVEAAARLGARGDTEGADRVCAAIPEGTWREECHFRAGEELGHAGHAVAGLRHCARAGWFGRNCLTHTGWRMPRDPTLHPGLSPARLQGAFTELDAQVEGALAGAGDGLEGEGRDILRSRFAFNVYVGSGRCEPAAAHLPDPMGPVFRTGFAIEAVEQLGPDASVDALIDIWNEARPPCPIGPPRDGVEPGRTSLPLVAPGEQGVPHVPIYGGGLRLVGQTPEEDMRIAALEAMFWREETTADTFLPWIDAESPRVRWTAAKLLGRTAESSFSLPEKLTQISNDHADETVRWHAQQALSTKAWLAPARRPPTTSSAAGG